jgi:predicted amidohydrolase
MDEKVKIAGVQMEPKMLEKEHNLSRCLEMIQVTAKKGARLIVFPECALTGYCFSSLGEALPLAEPIPGPSTDKLTAACRELNVYVVIGLMEKDRNRCYNAAAFIGPQGLVGKHRKVHLPYLGVDRFVNHGDLPFTVYDTEVGRMGIGICYDVNFPEHARVMALQGADLIVVPTNWPAGLESIPSLVIPTRALENHTYCVAINRVGEERGFKFIGRSKVAHWLGLTLADGKPDEEDILYAEIEPATARDKHLVIVPGEFEVDLFNDRRPEFYDPLTKPLADTWRMR